jgi:hypothetical protein
MRLSALVAILALAALIAFTDDKAPGAGRLAAPTSYRPNYTPPRPSGTGGAPNIPAYRPPNYRPPNYKPQNNMRLVPVNYDVHFTFNTEVGKVRTVDPPTEFDEKGNIKKHTKEELKALKGDTPEEKKMPGYKSDLADIRVGDYVQVALSVYKTVPKKKEKPKKKGKDEAEEEKPKEKEKDGEEKEKEGKWVVTAQFIGKVTKADAANTDSEPKLTVQVSTVQVVQGNAKPGGNRNITVKPEQAQATLILIGKRPPEKLTEP